MTQIRTEPDKVAVVNKLKVDTAVPLDVAVSGNVTVDTTAPLNVSTIIPRGANTDAFGRLRTSAPFTEFGLKQLYDGNPLFYDTASVSGSGTSASHNATKASTTLTATASTAGKHVKQSKIRGVYQPGKSLAIFCTCSLFGSSTGITKEVGYFDDYNGLFFRSSGGTLSVVRRTYTSGSAVDTAVAQSSWNIDTMDGTGASGITLDVDKANIYVVDFEWLGVGAVRMGVNIDGITYYVHEFKNANNLDVVYMQNPNLPIRYSIENGGTGTSDLNFETICATIISEGGEEDVSVSTYVSRGTSSINTAASNAFTPLISVRLKQGTYGTSAWQLSTRARPNSLDIFTTATANYEWKLFLNPTVAGSDAASWTNVTNSALQYDVTRDNTNTITGGYVIDGGYGSNTKQSIISLSSSVDTFLSLGATIDETPDELVLAVSDLGAGGNAFYGAMTFGEYT